MPCVHRVATQEQLCFWHAYLQGPQQDVIAGVRLVGGVNEKVHLALMCTVGCSFGGDTFEYTSVTLRYHIAVTCLSRFANPVTVLLFP